MIPARRYPAPAPGSSGAPGRPPVATPGGCGGRLLAGFRCSDLRATPKGSPSRRRWTSMPDGQLRTLCDACQGRSGASSAAGGGLRRSTGTTTRSTARGPDGEAAGVRQHPKGGDNVLDSLVRERQEGAGAWLRDADRGGGSFGEAASGDGRRNQDGRRSGRARRHGRRCDHCLRQVPRRGQGQQTRAHCRHAVSPKDVLSVPRAPAR